MSSRIEKLLEVMGKRGLDAIIVYGEMNRRYLSGFTGSSGYLYISRNKRVFLTDFRYMEQGGKQCVGYEVIDHSALGVIKALHSFAASEGAKRIGFEANIITFDQYKELSDEFSGIELVPATDMIEEIRMIKDESELALIRQAAKIADSAFTHILPYLKVGVSEIDIALELEFFMKKQGADKLSFDTIIASGNNSSLPHAHPTNKKIESGDFVTMDFGCLYEGYCSDMTRTVVVGKASEKQKLIYNTVLQAHEAALAILKAGLEGNVVDRVARDIIDAAGYKENFGHGLGHSLGLEVHENPRLSPKGFTMLQPNMMVTVEPGIYIPNFGGVRIEDLVCVTASGYDNFTHSDKSLLEI
ncbi:MAG: aminopeptidase P family protein [Vallitaleaceae bacterium]|nr:aminopeptidase P family protein [Vallitaleaceae bacterium]